MVAFCSSTILPLVHIQYLTLSALAGIASGSVIRGLTRILVTRLKLEAVVEIWTLSLLTASTFDQQLFATVGRSMALRTMTLIDSWITVSPRVISAMTTFLLLDLRMKFPKLNAVISTLLHRKL